MKLDLQKRLAAKVAKVGVGRTSLDPARTADIKEAITKADIRSLIKQGVIKILPARSPSRVRAKARHEKRKKGQARGHGRRKGTAGARIGKKRVWINKIRSQRRLLKGLLIAEKISKTNYRMLYMKAKSGAFRNRTHLMFYVKQNNLLKK